MTLEEIAKIADQLHDLLLITLIQKKIGRMSDREMSYSRILQALSNAAFWRKTTEWAVQHNRALNAEQSLDSLNKNINECKRIPQEFGSITKFLNDVEHYISTI